MNAHRIRKTFPILSMKPKILKQFCAFQTELRLEELYSRNLISLLRKQLSKNEKFGEPNMVHKTTRWTITVVRRSIVKWQSFSSIRTFEVAHPRITQENVFVQKDRQHIACASVKSITVIVMLFIEWKLKATFALDRWEILG